MKSIRLFWAGLALAFLGSASVAQQAAPDPSPPPAYVPPAPPPFPNFGGEPVTRRHGTVAARRHVATVHRSRGTRTHVVAKHSQESRHHRAANAASRHKAKRGHATDKHQIVKRGRHQAAGKRVARHALKPRHHEATKARHQTRKAVERESRRKAKGRRDAPHAVKRGHNTARDRHQARKDAKPEIHKKAADRHKARPRTDSAAKDRKSAKPVKKVAHDKPARKLHRR